MKSTNSDLINSLVIVLLFLNKFLLQTFIDVLKFFKWNKFRLEKNFTLNFIFQLIDLIINETVVKVVLTFCKKNRLAVTRITYIFFFFYLFFKIFTEN